MVDLGEFEGKAVVGVRVEVRGVAGGLNKAVDVDPVVLMQGDEAYVCFKVDSASIRFDPADRDVLDGDQIRVQILPATAAVICTGELLDLAADAIDSMSQKIDEKARAAQKVKDDEKARAKEEAAIEEARAMGHEPIIDAGGVNPAAVPPPEYAADDDGTPRPGKAPAKKRAPRKRAPAKKAPAKKAPAKKTTAKK